jgi:hypothetical protein
VQVRSLLQCVPAISIELFAAQIPLSKCFKNLSPGSPSGASIAALIGTVAAQRYFEQIDQNILGPAREHTLKAGLTQLKRQRARSGLHLKSKCY